MSTTVKEALQAATISAMKAREKDKLVVLRGALAAIKQQEVDTQQSLSDAEQLAVITQLIKQRKDAFEQFQSANRLDLAAKEEFEMTLLNEFLPEPLSETELLALIQDAITASDAQSMGDMRRVIDSVKPQVLGRADLSQVSQMVKSELMKLA